MLVDAEHLARDNRRIKTLLKHADLRIANARIEDVDASAQRGVDKAMLRQLASCAWVDQNHNALITCATGTGKSYLACALGQMACRRGLRVLYRRMPRLLDDLHAALADGTYPSRIKAWARPELLIIDDVGLGQIRKREDEPTAAHALYNLIDRSTGALQPP